MSYEGSRLLDAKDQKVALGCSPDHGTESLDFVANRGAEPGGVPKYGKRSVQEEGDFCQRREIAPSFKNAEQVNEEDAFPNLQNFAQQLTVAAFVAKALVDT